jgi:AcrR family transcriptional regulator
MAAALRAFAQQGLLEARLEDIRRDAGVSTGALYHHFADKRDLAGTVYASALADYQAGMLATLREHPDAPGGVRAVVRYTLDWCQRNRDATRLLLNGRGLADETRLREINRDFLSQVRGWLAPHVHYGALRELDTDVFTALWLGPSLEYLRHWLDGRARRVPADVADALAQAAWHSLRTPEEGAA